MEKALFDWPVVLQYDVKAKYRLISRKFSGMKFLHPSVRLTNQKPRTFVSVRQTNQIALFPLVCCFCFVRAFLFQGHTKIALINSFCPPSYCLPMLLVKRSTQLPGTTLYPNVSLAIKICAKEGGKKKNGLRLPSLAFSWSLALCHQSLAFRARLLNAKPCKKRGA